MDQKSVKRKRKKNHQPSNFTQVQSRIGEKPQRNHKDSTFCLLFSEPARAIELYNAVTGENLPPDTELTYTTLKNAIYIDRNNDLSFVVKDRYLVMSECQSTINRNIPMRCLGYVNRTLENLAGREVLYGRNLVKFPAPEFYLFYVGKEPWDRKTLRLSESFLVDPKENSLELVVNLINLSYTETSEILQRSPSLLGYSKLLYHIQEELSANGGDLKQAAHNARRWSPPAESKAPARAVSYRRRSRAPHRDLDPAAPDKNSPRRRCPKAPRLRLSRPRNLRSKAGAARCPPDSPKAR